MDVVQKHRLNADKREGYQSCARPRERLVWSCPCQKNWGRSCGFVKAIIASIVHNDSISRAILRIEGAKARPASASSNGNTVPCFHKRYGMGPGFKKVFSLACQSRMAHKPQASLCQTNWPVGCKRTLLLDGYNITCKALEISAIIKGSRGKRDSNTSK